MTRCQRASIPPRGPGRVHGEDGEPRARDQAGGPFRIDRRRPHLQGGGMDQLVWTPGECLLRSQPHRRGHALGRGTGTAGSSPASAWTGRQPGRTAAQRGPPSCSPRRSSCFCPTPRAIRSRPRPSSSSRKISSRRTAGTRAVGMSWRSAGLFWHLEPGGSGRGRR